MPPCSSSKSSENNESIGSPATRAKLLFVITEDWYFWSHRLRLAQVAKQNGYDVVIATRVQEYNERISNEGFRLVPLTISRESYSPFREFATVRQLRRLYRSERPDIVHQVALKPILYGSLAALKMRNIRVVNNLAGQGFLRTSPSIKARLLRLLIWNAFRFLLRQPQSWSLVQNEDDYRFLARQIGVEPKNIYLVRGSGVDLQQFRPSPEPSGDPVVLLASRMLWNKGVREFVEAAQLVRRKGIVANFVLAGRTDPSSPAAISERQLMEWQNAGSIQWWGHCEDMPAIMARSNLVCLPSYAEGVPKVLLEAAASGRAIVATDVAGCRDVVRDKVNGLLVPARDSARLADAIIDLLNNPGMRQGMGQRGRKIAESEFSQELVTGQILDVYQQIIGNRISQKPGTAQVAR